jgi:hypothetical protein
MPQKALGIQSHGLFKTPVTWRGIKTEISFELKKMASL